MKKVLGVNIPPLFGHHSDDYSCCTCDCCFNIESHHLISLFTQILMNAQLYQDFVSEAPVSILSARTDVNVNLVKSRIPKLTHVKVRFDINTGMTDGNLLFSCRLLVGCAPNIGSV